MSVCPCCSGRSKDGLMCSADWAQLRRDLSAVADLLADLEIAASKQARLTPPTPGGLASERNPVGWDAAAHAAALSNCLTTWARDVSGNQWSHHVARLIAKRAPRAPYLGPFCPFCWHESCGRMTVAQELPVDPPAVQATGYLLEHEPDVRAHPASGELWADITGHIHRARAAIDRQDRHIDIGECPDCGGTLRAHLPAHDDRPASVTCRDHPEHHYTPDQWLRLGRRLLAAKGADQC